MKTHEQLIAKIKSRKGAGLEFGRGIWTADKYVESLAQCMGVGICQTYFGNAQKSFSALLKEASQKLTYTGPDLVLEADCMGEVKLATSESAIKKVLDGIELPKHAMLAFTHILTTPKEDRDGDVLETGGALVDLKMPLLWQHIHTLPIGKLLKVVEHNDEKLRLASVLLDINQLTSDACKLFEAGALRFSHGFRALEFNERNKEAAGAPGFRVKKFEIMEESGVSVPSNIDAEVELLSRGKLKSPEFKAHAKAMQRLLPKKFTGMTLKLGGLGDLKAAADSGMLKTIADQGVAVLEVASADGGHHDHAAAQPCGCGGKSEKAGMDPESYNTREEAEARATVLGCAGSHAEIAPSGKIVWHPCQDAWSYSLYGKPPVDPGVAKPTGRADAKPTLSKDGNPIPKVYVNSDSLRGSYYNRIAKLGEDAQRFLMGSGIELDRDDYASVWALFDGYGIIQVCSYDGPGGDNNDFYRADWTEGDGEPKWSGLPTQVEVSSDINITEASKEVAVAAEKSMGKITGTRAGRTLSQANVDRLNIIKQDLAEIVSGDAPRSVQALAERCQRIIEELISSAVPVLDEDPQPKTLTPEDAIEIVLDSKNPKWLMGVAKQLNAVLAVHQKDEQAKQYRNFVRRK